MKKEKILNEKTLNIVLIILFVLLNIIIKSIYLGYHNVDLDEPTTILRAEASFSDLITMLKIETNQPLFFIIMHFWIKLFGLGAISLRFLPMLFSSLAVIFVYLLGKKFSNIVVAAGASFLYSFSNINIFHAHDARVYGIFVFLACASMYCYFLMIDSENKRKYAIPLTIINILILYAHLCGVFILIIQAFYTLVISSVRKNIFKNYLLSSVITFFAFLPYIIFILPTFTNPVQQINDVVTKPTTNDLSGFLIGFSNNFNNYLWFVSIIVIFILVALITRKEISIYHKMIFGWFIIPYFLMFALSTKIHINVIRFMIFITPAFYLSIIIAVYYFTRYKLIAVLLIITCVSFMITSVDLKASYDLNVSEAVKIIRKNKTELTKVYIVPPWVSLAFSYHYNLDILKDYKNIEKRLNNEQIFLIKSVTEIDTSSLKYVENVLLLDGWDNLKALDPQHKIYRTLLKNLKTVDTVANVTGYVVYNFGFKRTVKEKFNVNQPKK